MLREYPLVHISIAKSPVDFLFLRKLRNEVRQNMTNLTEHLSVWAQLKFYIFRPSNMEIYIARFKGRRVAYMLLSDKDGCCFITEAVSESFRKKNIALTMIKFAQTIRTSLFADVLVTNLVSQKLHEKAGFSKITQQNNIIRYSFNLTDDLLPPTPIP
jgi:hypothetical protein